MKQLIVSFINGTRMQISVDDLSFWKLVEPTENRMVKVIDLDGDVECWINPIHIETITLYTP